MPDADDARRRPERRARASEPRSKVMTMSTPRLTLTDLLDPQRPDPWDPHTWLNWPLDDFQRQPAHMDPGPALILGGAGTGKTHALLGRAIHLVRSGVDPNAIAIIASTAWTAQDMRVRLFQVIGCDPAAVGLHIGTLHDFCLTKLLRPYAASLPNLPQSFSVWTQGQSLDALARIVDSDPRVRTARRRRTDPAPILEWISANAQRTPGQRVKPTRGEWYRYAVKYRREKEAQHSLDRTDLLVVTRYALREHTDLRDSCAYSLTRHLLVDNFEDVSPLQYEIIGLMSGPEKSVCVAMDPNQSGGRLDLLLSDVHDRFETDHAEKAEYLLDINHRTSASLMASWRSLAQHDAMTALEDDGQREFRPQKWRHEAIAVDGTPQDQYRRIADDVRRLVDEGTFEADQIAILARRRQSLLRLRPHLEAAGLPFTALGDFIGTSDPEVQPVLAMLTLAVNPKNVRAFRKAGNRDVTTRIVSEVRSAAADPDNDLIKAAIQVRAGLPPDSIAHEDLSRLIDLYHELQGMMADGDSGVAAMLELVHHQIHGGDRASPPNSDDMTRLMACARNCDHDARTKAIFSADPGDGPAPINGRAALLDFLDRMASGIDIPPLPAPGVQIPLPKRFSSAWRPPDRRGISLATMDMSKGMEWPAVLVADASDHIIPGHGADGDTAMMAVEQRLFYSALTRAADWYALYWPQRQDDGTEAAPCRFIGNLLQ